MTGANLRADLSVALSGKKLFLKIFLWFWFTVLGVVAGFFLLPHLVDVHVVKQPNINATVAPILAAQAVRAYETDGAAGFRKFARENIEDQAKTLYLLDDNYHDVLSRDISSDGLRLAHTAKSGEITIFRSQIAAFRYVAASGRTYVFLLYLNRELGSLLARTGSDQVLYLTGIVLVVTLLCYWLARHIASPMLAIQNAARRVSEGDLQARAPAFLLKRHDELRELTSDFNTMVERIEALVQSQRRLLASVSHEVRSPLTRLAVAVALLRRFERPETEALLDRIDREVSIVDVLMGQLLTLARLETGVQRLRSEPANLSALLEEIVADANFEVESFGKAVHLHGASQMNISSADTVALRSALENVIRNASRFTPPGSAVQVKLEREEDGRVQRAVISIEDCGPGVPTEHLTSIFQPFFRLRHESEIQAGNGLGLTIAAEAIHLHGGSISAQNLPHGGLQVRIILPAHEGSLASRT